MPKVSIVLPVYNGERYLEEAIQSVLNQQYKDFELIIVDDCSQDKTASIAQSYAQKYSNVHYVRNEMNLKIPAALNKGFSLASGEYWTWTSHDNLYYPHALGTLVKAIESDPGIGLVYSDMDIIDDDGNHVMNLEAGPSQDLIFRNVVGSCFLYRRNIAEKVGLYDEKMFLCEDYEYWLRIGTITKLQKINETLYQYRRHPRSLSSLRAKEVIAKGIAIQKSFFPIYVKDRKGAAIFYAHLRARDIYNPFRHLYLLVVFYYHPWIFLKELSGLIARRFSCQ